MIYQKTQTLRIVDGPNKGEMVFSFYYARSKENLITCRVRDEEGDVYPIVVTSMQHEDGSGESFNLTGGIDLSAPRKSYKERYDKFAKLPNHFKGYYNSKTRNGSLVVTYFAADDK